MLIGLNAVAKAPSTTAVEDCNKEKSDAVKYLKEIMSKLNKVDDAQLKGNKKAFDAMIAAQAKLNELAKTYGTNAGDLGKKPVNIEQATVEEVKELQKQAILNYKNKLNTDLDLKLASGEEVNMDNIIAHIVKTDVTMDSAKVEKIHALVKTAGQAPTPTSETESPTDDSKSKVKVEEVKKVEETKAKAKYYY